MSIAWSKIVHLESVAISIHVLLSDSSASSNSNGNANFLDANFKDLQDFGEHFLFDFALGGKALPLEEADRLLKRGNREVNSADGAATNEQVNITLINGIPGDQTYRLR